MTARDVALRDVSLPRLPLSVVLCSAPRCARAGAQRVTCSVRTARFHQTGERRRQTARRRQSLTARSTSLQDVYPRPGPACAVFLLFFLVLLRLRCSGRGRRTHKRAARQDYGTRLQPSLPLQSHISHLSCFACCCSLQDKIKNAKTLQEIAELENMLKTGKLPAGF
jgi:hypothetical protein